MTEQEFLEEVEQIRAQGNALAARAEKLTKVAIDRQFGMGISLGGYANTIRNTLMQFCSTARYIFKGPEDSKIVAMDSPNNPPGLVVGKRRARN